MKVQRTADHELERFGLERLVEEIISAQPHGFQGIAAILVAGEDDDLGERGDFQDLLQGGQPFGRAVDVGGQAQIEQHDARLVFAHLGQCGFAVVGGEDLVPGKRPLELLLHADVVLDDEQPGLDGRFGGRVGGLHAGASTAGCGGACGRVRRNVVPLPGALSTSTLPPMATMVSRHS
jgi:hypothetical protein